MSASSSSHCSYATAYATPPDSTAPSRRASLDGAVSHSIEDPDFEAIFWESLPEDPEAGSEALAGVVQNLEALAEVDARQLERASRSRSRGRTHALSGPSSRSESTGSSRSTEYSYQSFATADSGAPPSLPFTSAAASHLFRRDASTSPDYPMDPDAGSSRRPSPMFTGYRIASSSTSLASMVSASEGWTPPTSPGPAEAASAQRRRPQQAQLKPLTALDITQRPPRTLKSKPSVNLASLRSQKSSASLVTVAASVGSHESFKSARSLPPPPRLS